MLSLKQDIFISVTLALLFPFIYSISYGIFGEELNWLALGINMILIWVFAEYFLSKKTTTVAPFFIFLLFFIYMHMLINIAIDNLIPFNDRIYVTNIIMHTASAPLYFIYAKRFRFLPAFAFFLFAVTSILSISIASALNYFNIPNTENFLFSAAIIFVCVYCELKDPKRESNYNKIAFFLYLIAWPFVINFLFSMANADLLSNQLVRPMHFEIFQFLHNKPNTIYLENIALVLMLINFTGIIFNRQIICLGSLLCMAGIGFLVFSFDTQKMLLFNIFSALIIIMIAIIFIQWKIVRSALIGRLPKCIAQKLPANE